MSNYQEKLKHPKWQKKRLEILQRDEFKCLYCKDTETQLQVHHLKYTKEPWDAPNENLKTVCSDCHGLVTFNKELEDVIKIEKINGEYGYINFFIKYRMNEKIYIGLYDYFDNTYNNHINFLKDGVGINKLISLNNG